VEFLLSTPRREQGGGGGLFGGFAVLQIALVMPSGQIADIIGEHVHVGQAIVSGPDWSGPVTSPNFRIIDVDATLEALRQGIAQAHLTATDISTVASYFDIDVNALSAEAQERLGSNGRASASLSEVVSASKINEAWTAATIAEVEQDAGAWVE